MTTSTLSLRDRAVSYVRGLQDTITSAIEQIDGGASFREDRWERTGGGGGITRVICDGAIFEKGGVNTSTVYGTIAEATAQRADIRPGALFATGISIVLHPRSPRIPTVHANLRYFESGGHDAWFGGGMDLTPYAADPYDPTHFHETLRAACAGFGEDLYSRFKHWCDEYFYLPHRREHRGVGGIFFDELTGDSDAMERWLAFVQRTGDAFLPAYLPIVERHRDDIWSERERKFQMLRRGRYVEFNLLYDRGTTFGLATGGRVESILMSLPPVVQFEYDAEMETTDEERTLTSWLRTPRDWVGTAMTDNDVRHK